MVQLEVSVAGLPSETSEHAGAANPPAALVLHETVPAGSERPSWPVAVSVTVAVQAVGTPITSGFGEQVTVVEDASGVEPPPPPELPPLPPLEPLEVTVTVLDRWLLPECASLGV